jgi:prepilin-type N-terminal cleavage/methylation domain-containing protein
VRVHNQGLTLVELVVALTVTAIIASFSVTLISAPPAAMEASTRRASLGENAAQTVMQVERDWRNALPNSLRFRSTAGVLAVE